MDHNLKTVLLNVMYAKSVALRDHSLQTAEISSMIVRNLLDSGNDPACSPEDAYTAGLLHDIGKLFVSESILNKPSVLTDREMETMRLHTSWGLQFVKNTSLERYAEVVVHHHENAAGTGYPHGLRASELAPLTKVVRIADTLSALLEDRPYRRSIADDRFILSQMEQDLEGLFNGSSEIVCKAVINYLSAFRKHKAIKEDSYAYA
ncbi:HD-GYP domain-containing protein [Geobacter sp. FeAm09]|uniref:HD-GYP domain-containing protein n=1 Tax=Geobacter sp. FeAm09 TaxID=2597769 RepID=UPI00143D9C33|nr:HD domain-containing phosphohydrolase [Geobacter sp. FeAm09]